MLSTVQADPQFTTALELRMEGYLVTSFILIEKPAYNAERTFRETNADLQKLGDPTTCHITTLGLQRRARPGTQWE